MRCKEIVNNIINKYNNEYKFLPTASELVYSLPKVNMIILSSERIKNPNNFFAFSILHEIGHIKTYKKEHTSATKEYLATQWAINENVNWNIPVNDDEKKIWQEYIYSYTKEKDKSKYLLDWSAM